MKVENLPGWSTFEEAIKAISGLSPEKLEEVAKAAIETFLEDGIKLPPNTTFEPLNPVELLPGRTYVIETEHHLNDKAKQRLLARLYVETNRLGCRFIILDGGLKIAKG